MLRRGHLWTLAAMLVLAGFFGAFALPSPFECGLEAGTFFVYGPPIECPGRMPLRVALGLSGVGLGLLLLILGRRTVHSN